MTAPSGLSRYRPHGGPLVSCHAVVPAQRLPHGPRLAVVEPDHGPVDGEPAQAAQVSPSGPDSANPSASAYTSPPPRVSPTAPTGSPASNQVCAPLTAAGGVPAVLGALGLAAPAPPGGPRWPIGDPVTSLPAFMVVHGNLAPAGAVIKAAAASADLLRHRGPAVVFYSHEDMRRRIEDPTLDVTAESVLVLAGCGPAGMAMPEWGNIPIPARLLSKGVTDMLRITDGRMSRTGFGTVVLHAAPESAVGGPLSRLRDGDIVSLDAYAGSLSVEADLASRSPVLPDARDTRGWPVLHRMHVPQGCDYDFLRPVTAEELAFVEPVIGRS